MPPFHSRSTGASRIAWISWTGVIFATPGEMPSASATCGLIGIDLSEREYTPPPSEIRLLS